MPHLKVLFLGHTAKLSGGELALLHLIRHLDRNRVEPIILLGEDGPLAEKLSQLATVHIEQMQARVSHMRKDTLHAGSVLRLGIGWAAFQYMMKLVRFIRKHDIDLIHTNTLKADVLGGLAGIISATPVVWHVRDRIAEDYLPGAAVKAFRSMAGWVPTAIIANSQATARTLKLRQKRQASMHVIHDGVELDVFRPVQARAARSQGKVIGLVGRITPWKGQDIFLRAARLVCDRYPDTEFRVIGSALFGERDYEAALVELRSELGLEAQVAFRGFRENIAGELAELDIFVHASCRPEPFGQVIIEAMAAGVPVIATDGGGVPEIVQDGMTGLLIPMKDPGSMAAAICRLIEDPVLTQSIAEQGRENVKQHFSMQKTAAAVQEIFFQLAGNRLHAKESRQPAAAAASD